MLVDHVEDLFRDLGAVPVRMVRTGEPVVRVLDQLRPAELLAVHFRLEAGALVEPAAHSLVALAVDEVSVDRVEFGEVRLPGGAVWVRSGGRPARSRMLSRASGEIAEGLELERASLGVSLSFSPPRTETRKITQATTIAGRQP